MDKMGYMHLEQVCGWCTFQLWLHSGVPLNEKFADGGGLVRHGALLVGSAVIKVERMQHS